MLSYEVEPAVAERMRDMVAIGSAAFFERFRRPTHANALEGITGKRGLWRWVTADNFESSLSAVCGKLTQKIKK